MIHFSKVKNYETILAIVLGLLVIWYFTGIAILIYCCLALVMIGLLFPSVTSIITWIWFKIAEILGWFMSKFLLSVIFYLVLVPIAFLSRLFITNSLNLKKSNNTSYFQNRNHKYTSEDMEHPW